MQEAKRSRSSRCTNLESTRFRGPDRGNQVPPHVGGAGRPCMSGAGASRTPSIMSSEGLAWPPVVVSLNRPGGQLGLHRHPACALVSEGGVGIGDGGQDPGWWSARDLLGGEPVKTAEGDMPDDVVVVVEAQRRRCRLPHTG